MPSLSTSSSSVSATIRVHRATSELLVAPDWTINMEICDYSNSNRRCSKDIVKQIKRRLQHKNSKVQLLTLTLLEMMVKNCGEYIHHQISERKVLDEMIKLVKKKGDANVRERILALLDSWQETFGGPGRKHSQYFWAYDELRRLGAHFPPRSQCSVATPSLNSTTRVSPFGFGTGTLPNSSRRLDEAMPSEAESINSTTLESIRNVLELLDDMLQAVSPNNRMAVKEEVTVDLVECSRMNQKKLMQMISTTTDEDFVAQGIEMNDLLQTVLAKHDVIASGAPFPYSSSFKGQVSFKTRKGKGKSPIPNDEPSSSSAPPPKSHGKENGEDEFEFRQLARRHSKGSSTPLQSAIMGSNDQDDASSCNSNSNALVLIDAPAPTSAPTTTSNSKEQDLTDLLSIVLTTSSAPNDTPQAPTSATEEALLQEPMNNYIVPWAQPQAQQPQCHMGYSQYSPSGYSPPWEVAPAYPINQNIRSNQLVSRGDMNNCCYTWSSQSFNSFQISQYRNQPMFGNALNPASMKARMPSLQQANSFQHPTANVNRYLNPQGVMNQHPIPTKGAQSLQHVNSYPTMTTNGFSTNGNPTMKGSRMMSKGSNGVDSGQNKPYIPSYRLFEELDIIGSDEGKIKSGPYSRASEKPMVANRRS